MVAIARGDDDALDVLLGGALRVGAQLIALGTRLLEALPQVFSLDFLPLEVFGDGGVALLEAGDVQSVGGRAVGHRFRSSGVPASDVYCRVDGVNLFHHHRVRSVFVAMKRRGRVYTLYIMLFCSQCFGLACRHLRRRERHEVGCELVPARANESCFYGTGLGAC